MKLPKVQVLDERNLFSCNSVLRTKKSINLHHFKEVPLEQHDLINKLRLADCVVIASPTEALIPKVLDSLNSLDLIICPEIYKNTIDIEICKKNGINIKLVHENKIGLETLNAINKWMDEQVSTNADRKRFYQNPEEIHNILSKKKVKYLYHANTLATSQTFIEQGAILSRGYVEKHGLYQTIQTSDMLDKKFDIWDDIFIDGIDIHAHHRKPNKYGPILFCLNTELLLTLQHPLLITRFNPIYWPENSVTWKNRYLTGSAEFMDSYLDWTNTSSRMAFTIKECDKDINLSSFLKEIIVDISSITISGKDMGLFLKNELEQILKANGLEQIPVNLRHCITEKCNCIEIYEQLISEDEGEFKKRIRPKK